jgi:hypothetical protein
MAVLKNQYPIVSQKVFRVTNTIYTSSEPIHNAFEFLKQFLNEEAVGLLCKCTLFNPQIFFYCSRPPLSSSVCDHLGLNLPVISRPHRAA